MPENSKIYDAYVDGSFSAKFDKGAWAYTIVDSEMDKSIAEGVGLLNYTLQPELRKLRNIATECRAVIEALDYASVYNMRLNVYYDYIGLQRWVWDITENQTPWQCKNDFTWEYRQDVIRYEKYLNISNRFVKVIKVHQEITNYIASFLSSKEISDKVEVSKSREKKFVSTHITHTFCDN